MGRKSESDVFVEFITSVSEATVEVGDGTGLGLVGGITLGAEIFTPLLQIPLAPDFTQVNLYPATTRNWLNFVQGAPGFIAAEAGVNEKLPKKAKAKAIVSPFRIAQSYLATRNMETT